MLRTLLDLGERGLRGRFCEDELCPRALENAERDGMGGGEDFSVVGRERGTQQHAGEKGQVEG